MKLLCALLCSLLFTVDGGLFRTNSRDYHYHGNDVGLPLYLSPYIAAGKLKEGRDASRVLPIEGITHESYSGYITVNRTQRSNMFFWFWPAQENPEKAPVLLWLQGGPGGSSLFSLFVETGPYYINEQQQAVPREINWNKDFSVLYIDNPVMTGYSFTTSGFAKTQADVARDLYSCLVQFFTLFPDYAKNDFYLTGESYAGKYIPAIGYKIHIENPKAKLKINLKGASIGDGFTDPVTMIPQYADYIYNIGMFDENERDYFRTQTDEIVAAIRRADYIHAFNILGPLLIGNTSPSPTFYTNTTAFVNYDNYMRPMIFDYMFNGDISPFPTYFTNITGSKNYDNYFRIGAPASYGYYEKFVTSADVRRAIHVGNLTYNSGREVEMHMRGDMMKSEKAAFTVLVDNYRVLVYTGQLDVIVALPLTEAFLQTVPWEGLQEYRKAKKVVWRLDGDVAGYVRNVRDFYQVLVRQGGHILPHDQPARCLNMLTRFIRGMSFA